MSGNDESGVPKFEGSAMYLPDSVRVDKQQFGMTIPLIVTVVASAFAIGAAWTATESSVNEKMAAQAAYTNTKLTAMETKLDDMSKDFKAFRSIFVGEDGQLKGKWQKVAQTRRGRGGG